MALDTDELEPRRPAPKPRDLETLAIAELENYIAELEGEIARARAVIARKRDHRSGADAVFKKK
jgi:uncharacterized small protein (DUF1192 family)